MACAPLKNAYGYGFLIIAVVYISISHRLWCPTLASYITVCLATCTCATCRVQTCISRRVLHLSAFHYMVATGT